MKKYVFGFVFFVVVSTLWAAKTHYEIGDEGEGGGIVFYVSKEGFKVYDGKGGSVICHYLEMSKNSLGTSYWFPLWEDRDIGTTEHGLGYGKSNTYKILNAKTSKSLTVDNCAAYRASKFFTTKTKAGDWWLPSKDELNLMYQNQKDAVIATSCNLELGDWHWSSSESTKNDAGHTAAWLQPFRDTKGGNEPFPMPDFELIDMFSVRAVRAF